MSNFHALGFVCQTRAEAEGLARAPLRHAEGQMRLLDGRSVTVHRLEVGGGIELWSIVQQRRVVASYPAFLAREARPAVVEAVTFPRSPFTPRLWLAAPTTLVCQLINYPFIPAGALQAGTLVQLNLSALMPKGLSSSDQPPGIAVPDAVGGKLPEIVADIGGAVTATERFTNQVSGRDVVWARLLCGDGGALEVIGAAENMADAEVGQVVRGTGTLRGAVTEILSAEA